MKVGTIMYIDNNVKNVLSDIEARAKGGSLLIFAHQHQHYITHILWLGKNQSLIKSLLVNITYLEKLEDPHETISMTTGT